MFTGKYFDWNQKKLKGIIDHYGQQFMLNKKVLDLGAGYADIGGPLSRLGAEITAVDARKEHLDIAAKRYPGIKTIVADLDRNWPFVGQTFDIILDLGLLCHLLDYEKHLQNVCNSTKFLVLETAVCDDQDDKKSVAVKESKNIFDLSINGMGSRPTSTAIERVLKECGMSFTRITNNKFNSGSYTYDWAELNNSDCNFNKRRIWFCVKENSGSVTPTNITSEIVSSNQIISAPLVSNNISIRSQSLLEASQQVRKASVSSFHPQKSAETKINFILNIFSNKYFYNKFIFDAGSGNGEIGAALARLGASITAADARQEHLNNIRNKYPNIKTLRLNFESPLNINTKFDITLSIDTLCHISNYEKHLKDLCSRSKNIILETAVCDSSDPNISFSVSENNTNNSLSFSGLASRPSAAKIEKILADNGMMFVRLDSSKLNYENYVYDWKVINSKNTDLSLRRFWICSKNANVINEIIKKVKIDIEPPTLPPPTLPPPILPSNSSIDEPTILKDNFNVNVGSYKPNNILKISKNSAIIHPQNFVTDITYNLDFSVAPLTFSAKQWISKLHPYFPNIKIYQGIKNYKPATFTGGVDLSISSKDNILIAKNLFLEEYPDGLNSNLIDNLAKCQHIITPSFENYRELTTVFPDKKITKCGKSWLIPFVQPNSKIDEYAIYLEKEQEFTPYVSKCFSSLRLKNLVVVGSRVKLPANVIRYSEYEDYSKIVSLILGAKVIVDLSYNSNYDSGILNLAKAHQIPIITNNLSYLADEDATIFVRNNMANGKMIADEDAIKFAFSKFNISDKPLLNIDNNYNDNMYHKILSLLGQ